MLENEDEDKNDTNLHYTGNAVENDGINHSSTELGDKECEENQRENNEKQVPDSWLASRKKQWNELRMQKRILCSSHKAHPISQNGPKSITIGGYLKNSVQHWQVGDLSIIAHALFYYFNNLFIF